MMRDQFRKAKAILLPTLVALQLTPVLAATHKGHAHRSPNADAGIVTADIRPLPGHPNISDKYTRNLIRRVNAWYRDEQRHVGASDAAPDARFTTLALSDANLLSRDESYKGRTDLSPEQKELVAIVRDERKTVAGKRLTSDPAAQNLVLIADDQIAQGPALKPTHFSELTSRDDRLIRLEIKGRETLDYQKERPLHHALVIKWQDARYPMSPKLSSFDKALWRNGDEGQAVVASDEEYRIHAGLPLLSPSRKRALFEASTSSTYNIEETTRMDGAQMSAEAFAHSFGFVPGHKGEPNFLTQKAKDPAGFYDGTGIADLRDGPSFSQGVVKGNQLAMSVYRFEASHHLRRRWDLPVLDKTTDRYATEDAHIIVDVKHSAAVASGTAGSVPKIVVYKGKDLGGHRYYVPTPDFWSTEQPTSASGVTAEDHEIIFRGREAQIIVSRAQGDVTDVSIRFDALAGSAPRALIAQPQDLEPERPKHSVASSGARHAHRHATN